MLDRLKKIICISCLISICISSMTWTRWQYIVNADEIDEDADADGSIIDGPVGVGGMLLDISATNSDADDIASPSDADDGSYTFEILKVSEAQSEVDTYAYLKANSEITGIRLVSIELSLPDETSISNISTETNGSIEYAIDGQVVRIVLLSIDGLDLKIPSGCNIIKMNIKSPVAIRSQVVVVNAYAYHTSNDKRDINIQGSYTLVGSSSSTSSSSYEELVSDVSATKLYESDDTSEFIPSGKKAIRIELTDELIKDNCTLVFTYEGKDYKCYICDDMSDKDHTVYMALVDSTVDDAALEVLENYSVASEENKHIMLGDVNHNGEISSADALEIVKMWVGTSTAQVSPYTILTYNVNGDHTIDNADALSIMEKITDGKTWKILE